MNDFLKIDQNTKISATPSASTSDGRRLSAAWIEAASTHGQRWGGGGGGGDVQLLAVPSRHVPTAARMYYNATAGKQELLANLPSPVFRPMNKHLA